MTTLIKRNNGVSKAPQTFGGLFDQMFRSNLNRVFDDDFWGFNGQLTDNQVPVNLRETDSLYELQLIAPGLKKEDFKVNLNGDLLNISFEHKEEHKKDSTDGWLRREYLQRSFSRSFRLEDAVDTNKITAKYANGILLLTLPKKEGSKALSKTIEIK